MTCSPFFPVLHAAWNDLEQRVGGDPSNRRQITESLRIPLDQFRHEVIPFVFDLPAHYAHAFHLPAPRNLADVEFEPPTDPFRMHDPQVCRDTLDRRPRLPESNKLGMAFVSLRLPFENGLRQ